MGRSVTAAVLTRTENTTHTEKATRKVLLTVSRGTFDYT